MESGGSVGAGAEGGGGVCVLEPDGVDGEIGLDVLGVG